MKNGNISTDSAIKNLAAHNAVQAVVGEAEITLRRKQSTERQKLEAKLTIEQFSHFQQQK